MTTGEKLSSESTVSNVSALEHLLNIDGTGAGDPVIVPATSISADIEIISLSASLITETLSANIVDTLEADLEVNDLSADIEEKLFEGDLSCDQ